MITFAPKFVGLRFYEKILMENVFRNLLTIVIVGMSFTAFAAPADPQTGDATKAVDTKDEVTAFIDHHLADSHYYSFYADAEAGEHYGLPLPIILWDNGLKVFSSARFHHGEELVEMDGNYYRLYHSKIYKTDAERSITYGEKGYPSNERPLDFSLTKNVVTMILVSILMLILFSSLAKSYKKGPLPTGFGRVLEPLVLYVRDEIAKPN